MKPLYVVLLLELRKEQFWRDADRTSSAVPPPLKTFDLEQAINKQKKPPSPCTPSPKLQTKRKKSLSAPNEWHLCAHTGKGKNPWLVPAAPCVWPSHFRALPGILVRAGFPEGKMDNSILNCSGICQAKSEIPFKNWGFVGKSNKGALRSLWEFFFFMRIHLKQQMLRSLSAILFLYCKPEAAACLGTELLVRTAWEEPKGWANSLLASSQM